MKKKQFLWNCPKIDIQQNNFYIQKLQGANIGSLLYIQSQNNITCCVNQSY